MRPRCVKTANTNLANANSALKAAQTTQANAQLALDQANSALASAKATETQAHQALASATQAQTNANNALNASKQTLKNANDALADAKSKQAAAKDALTKAQQNVKDTDANLASAKSALTDATNKLNNAKSAVAFAQQALDQANQGIATKTALVASATKANDDAQADLQAKTTAMQAAQKAVQDAQATYNQLSKQADSLQASIDSYVDNTQIKVPAGMKAAYDKMVAQANLDSEKGISSLDDPTFVAYKADFVKIAKEGLNLNSYHSNDLDKQNVIARKGMTEVRSDFLNHLTFDQRLELSQFAADLINNTREAYGDIDTAGRVVVSKGAMDYIEAVAQKETADDWSAWNGHDNKVLNDLAPEYGLKHSDYPTNWFEDQAGTFISKHFMDDVTDWDATDYPITMDALKHGLYDAFVSMVFNDNDANSEGKGNLGHTSSLLGTEGHANVFGNMPADQRISYFGIATANSATDKGVSQQHWCIIPNVLGHYPRYSGQGG